jgi:hypothetical protein
MCVASNASSYELGGRGAAIDLCRSEQTPSRLIGTSRLCRRMRLKPAAVKRVSASMLAQLREGWDYVAGFTPIRTILTLFATLSLMGWPFAVLMPVFASTIF